MSKQHNCQTCGFHLGQWVCVDRASPQSESQAIYLGTLNPGPEWWSLVKRFWDVSDRPTPQCWQAPVLAKLTKRGCTLCASENARNITPSLFEEAIA